MPMPLSFLSSRMRQVGAALILSAAALPALAIPLMDMHLEDLMPMAADFKQELNLNANQLTLWNQTEGKTRQLLRERQSRREHLQAATSTALENRSVELRELVGAVDAETTASAAEEKQLREWWLTVNDALNETQRQKVAVFISEQMMRVADPGTRPAAEHPQDSGQKSGKHRGGMGGGMGGNGGSVSIPGG